MTYEARPWSLNQERKHHWSWRNKRVEEWREAFAWLALEARLPRCERVGFAARTYMKGTLFDPVNDYPTVKAAIDGVVEAGVIPDDTAEHVAWVKFHPPERSSLERLELTVFRLG